MEHYRATIDYATVIEYAFTQYYLKHGLEGLGEKGEKAVTEEMSQIHAKDTFYPKSAEHLTDNQSGSH